MKNLKQNFIELCVRENRHRDDDRLFLDEITLDQFAKNHNLANDEECYDKELIENACDCRIIYDYAGANPNRIFGDVEIFF